VPYSPATGLPIESQTISQMVDRIMALPQGTRLYLLAPVVRGRKGEYRKELADWMKRGFQRVKIDGQFYEIAQAPALDKKFKHRHRRGGRPRGGATRSRDPLGRFAGNSTAPRRRLAVAEFADASSSPPLKGGGRRARRAGWGSRRSTRFRSPTLPRIARGDPTLPFGGR